MFMREDSDGRKTASGVLGALEDVFNPMAARMRREMDQQHEQALPMPTPGDRMLRDNKIVITVPKADSL